MKSVNPIHCLVCDDAFSWSTWSNRTTEKTPQMFGLVRSWTYFQRGWAIGCKKGPSRGVLTLSLPKVSLFYQRCALLICIHGCGICSQHGACSRSTHWCGCTNLKIQLSLFGKNNIQLLHGLGFSTLANKKTSATFKTSLFLLATGTN